MSQRRLRILVADNEPTIIEWFRRVITELGHHCDDARDGQHCLKQMAQKVYDLVFLDLVMPGIDGAAALETIRERHPDTAVVVVSSQDDDVVIARLLTRGARAYLMKPVEQKHLEEVITGLASTPSAEAL